MGIIRQTLFESEGLQIGLVEARNVSDRCGEIERQDRNCLVLPLNGVFSKHDTPKHCVMGTPSHAVFIGADTPYRIGFPGAIGDRALSLRFDDALAPDYLDRSDGNGPTSNGLLPTEAMVLRNLLHARLAAKGADRFEIETRAIGLLDICLGAMRRRDLGVRPSAEARWLRALERIKGAVAADPADKWNVGLLADIAGLSPFHLCRVFRRITGTSIYDYVLRERLASSLDAILDGKDLTTVALDAGFASHSHFTAHFRRLFGSTPTALRRHLKTDGAAELRKIVTAQRARKSLD
jgi:AraC-like DNA-binding protein